MKELWFHRKKLPKVLVGFIPPEILVCISWLRLPPPWIWCHFTFITNGPSKIFKSPESKGAAGRLRLMK